MYSSIENFRKSVQSRLPTMPHLHLAFLHLKLLADRHLENNRPNATRVHDGAQQMVTLLLQNPGASPLTHHWAGLAAITLAEFQDGAIAQRALRDLRGGFQSGHIRQWKGKALIWDTAIVGYITKKLEHTQDSSDSIAGDRGPLGQLADAALNKNPVKSGQAGNIPDGIREYEVPMDWSAATMNGYLNSFAEDDG